MNGGAYGERLGRAVRLERPPVLSVQVQGRVTFAATRITLDVKGDHGKTEPLAHEDAFLISSHLRDSIPFRLWLNGQAKPVEMIRRGTIMLVDLSMEPIANLRGPFDSLVFYVPRSALIAIAEEQGARKINSLDMPPGRVFDDPIVEHLGSSLLPALERPEQVSRLFLDHVAMALQLHLTGKYGHLVSASLGRLAPWQERRSKDLLMSRLDGDLSLEEVARECGLSPSHFARAFKRTTGEPPHRWLLARRIERARELLVHSKLPIADVAGRLGFADQSHFTRVFSRTVGATPGAWRRLRS